MQLCKLIIHLLYYDFKEPNVRRGILWFDSMVVKVWLGFGTKNIWLEFAGKSWFVLK